jgi:acyl-coenzyme A synthetase/AMP-(fatty) acid ligase
MFFQTLVSIAEHSRLYRTGDFASLVKGSLLYEGRTDSQVKVRGHRVDLSEVERAVAAVPNIDKSVVLCYRPGEIQQVKNLMMSHSSHSEV